MTNGLLRLASFSTIRSTQPIAPLRKQQIRGSVWGTQGSCLQETPAWDGQLETCRWISSLASRLGIASWQKMDKLRLISYTKTARATTIRDRQHSFQASLDVKWWWRINEELSTTHPTFTTHHPNSIAGDTHDVESPESLALELCVQVASNASTNLRRFRICDQNRVSESIEQPILDVYAYMDDIHRPLPQGSSYPHQ